MKRHLFFFLLVIALAPVAPLAAGSGGVVLDVNVFQGFRASAPAGEPFSSPLVVLPPDPGWSGEIEKQRSQIAETLGLDGATIIGKVRILVPPGSTQNVDFPREGAAPLVVELKPSRQAANRVSLEISLRERQAPPPDLATFSVSGELGKTFIVGGKSSSGPLLVSVTPRDPETVPEAADMGREIHKIGGDVKPPTLVRRVEPKYPDKLRADKKTGLVVLQIIVDEQGLVRNPVIVRHSEPELDAAALEAVRQWQYSPATLHGKLVAIYLTITVSFRLD